MLHATYMAGVEYYPSDMMQRDQDFIAPGVITTDDLVVAPTSVPSMAVTVSGATQGSPGGNAWLPGGYRAYNDAQATLIIAAADTTNPRIDLVVAAIDTTATPYTPSLQVIMGAPATSPIAPSIPVGLIVLTLAQIEVPANATSIVAENITDKRVVSGLQGDGSRLRNIPSSAVPVATSTTAGIVKSSSSILVAADGTLSATPDSIGADPAGAAASAQTAAEAYSDTALAAHQADYVRQPGYGIDTGTANNYVITLNPAPTSYVDGMGISIEITNASTGASTLNVNGLGAKSILDSLGNAVTSGGLRSGLIYSMRYNATSGNFIVQGKGGGGNATAGDLLSGKTATVDTGPITGTILSKGTASYTPTTTDQVIAAGQYLSGVQTIPGDPNLVTANIKAGSSIFGVTGKSSVVDTSDANAIASQILAGLYAYVNGLKITGTIPSKTAQTYTPGTTDQTIASAQYLSGAQTIKGDSNLIAANILSGNSIFGVAGSAVDVKTIQPGTNILYSDATNYYVTNASSSAMQLLCQASISGGVSGTIRVSFDLKANNSSATDYAQIYKNGSPVGTLRSSNNSTSYTTYTEDIAFANGDYIQIYGHGNGDGYNSPYVQNFKLGNVLQTLITVTKA